MRIEKKIMAFAYALIIFLLFSLTAGAEGTFAEYVFSTKKAVAAFVSHSTTKMMFDSENSYLKFNFDNNPDPLCVSFFKDGDVNLDKLKYIKIKLYAGCESTSLQLFFSNIDSPELSEGKMTSADYKPWLWNEIIIDMSKVTEWKGMLNTLRFDPCASSVSGEYMLVEYISFFETKEQAAEYRPLTKEQQALNDEYYSKQADEIKNSPYYYQGALAFKFNSYQNIIRLTSGYNVVGTATSLVERAMLCKPYHIEAYIPLRMDKDMQFKANDFKYMKIKYYSDCVEKNFIFKFETEKSEGEFELRRTDGEWVEAVIDLNNVEGWDGLIQKFVIYLTKTHAKAHDDYCFIEYIAFFEDKSVADAYGGITGMQKLGQDPVTAYANGDRTSIRYKNLPVFGRGKSESTETLSISENSKSSAPTNNLSPIVLVSVAIITTAVISAAFLIIRRKRGSIQ